MMYHLKAATRGIDGGATFPMFYMYCLCATAVDEACLTARTSFLYVDSSPRQT